MADRSILFSAPMVRALLADTKTQTRRIIKPQPKLAPHHEPARPEPRGERHWTWMVHTDQPAYQFAVGDWKAPYTVGDRLYVREHWRTESQNCDHLAPREMTPGDYPVVYDADANWSLNKTVGRFRQGMHMPRWASRITLTVTDVRVQRLQEISEEDARAEGVDFNINGGPNNRAAYCRLWNTLHGPGSWDANPFVAAYSFTVALHNIDQEVPPDEV